MLIMTRRAKLVPIAILLLFVLQSLTPVIPTSYEVLDEKADSNSQQMWLVNGSGHQLAGGRITLDGDKWDVREEADLDHWSNDEIHSSATGFLSIHIEENGQTHACSVDGQDINYHLIHLNGTIETDLIETLSGNNTSFSCSVSVNWKGMVHVAYTDDDDLKIGRLAVPNAVYMNQTWHLRTIAEDIVSGEIEIVISRNSLMNIYFQDTNLALHHMWFNTAYWNSSILDPGPIGAEIEVSIDSDYVTHIVYTQTSENEVRLIRTTPPEETTTSYAWRGDELTISRQVIVRDSNITHPVAMDLDSNLIEQISYSKSDGSGNSTISLLRSLVGKDEGRIDPNVKWSLTYDDDSLEGLVEAGDLNNDGKDDLVYTDPVGNGTISIHYGSSSGPNDLPDEMIVGKNSTSGLGTGLAIGDWNCDGYDDIAASEPGLGVNNSGLVHITLGSADGISNTTWWNMTGQENDSLGWSLTSLGDVESDGCDDLAIVANATTIVMDGETEIIKQGIVVLLKGNESTMIHHGNLTQNGEGPMFGRSIAGGGDWDGDGYLDLAVSNTGTVEEPIGYSCLEFYQGGPNGISTNPFKTEQILTAGKLYGQDIEWVGDIDNDGRDDLLVSELYSSTGVYHSGEIHWWSGHEDGYLIKRGFVTGTYANAHFGYNIEAAGDINQDGNDDFLVMSLGSSSNYNGKVNIVLGSGGGWDMDQILAQGSAGEHVGMSLLAGMDLDGDGMGDILYSSRDLNRGESFAPVLNIKTERDWEFIDFEFEQEIISLEMGTSYHGSPTILAHLEDKSIRILEYTMDGTPSGRWTETDFGMANAVALDVTSAGKPLILHHHNSGLFLLSPTGHTGLEYNLLSAGSMGQSMGIATDSNGYQRIGFASEPLSQILYSEGSSTGWTSSQVRGSIDLLYPIDVHVDSNDLTNLIYVDDVEHMVQLATYNSSWSTLDLINTTIGDDFDSLWLDDSRILLAQIAPLNNSTALQVIEFDAPNETGTRNYTTSNIAIASTASVLEIEMVNETTIGLAWMDADRLKIAERNIDGGNWDIVEDTWLLNTTTGRNMAMDGGNIIFDSNGTMEGSLFRDIEPNNSTNWTYYSFDVPDTSSSFEYLVHNQRWELITTDSNHHLVWTTGHLASAELIVSTPFYSISSTGPAPLTIGNNDSITIAYHESTQEDLNLMRFYPDQDRDLIPDTHDALPLLGDQWTDSDGDGIGNNDLGPNPDWCPSDYGTATIGSGNGCEDYDQDGFADYYDTCVNDPGTSWWGRWGCVDYDQDGWSDNDAVYAYGDRFGENWKQALDSDGDGYGDNHGVDCCDTAFDNTAPPDLFPHNNKQWEDEDNDGYGDNSSDFATGDQCPWEQGYSWRDRLGCYDQDGDGSSDTSGVGTFTEWNVTHGADAWPQDPTQWADSDGDGFGDNSSEGATNPDKFPTNEAAANDTDGDWYPDNWTPLDNGTNRKGLELDGCPEEWGNSTNPLWGCVDSDGDGRMDSADDFPNDPTQLEDNDNDGWGDNQQGNDPDKCPFQPGVFNGTLGPGCPVINNDDDDGDSVANEYDECADTLQGDIVDSAGCSEAQKDDDQDGVFNDLDKCMNTEFGAVVDSDGCASEQTTVDSDGDGVFDPYDVCPDSNPELTVDENGCNLSQLDNDGDGVSNLLDECPDTPADYPVLTNGCTDDQALTEDYDGDGFKGPYSYDNSTGHTGDAFPFDATQWNDMDGDGYGDNQTAGATEPDYCPLVAGNSTMKFHLGCLDSDGDGYAEDPADDEFWNDSTQWSDEDFDGYGDNLSGNEPDLCPRTAYSRISEVVGYDGCSKSQRDTDGDGINDDIDTNCPNTPAGAEVYADGCAKKVVDDSDDTNSKILGMEQNIFFAVVGGSGLFLILIIVVVVVRVRARSQFDFDDDDDDDDWFDDDDDEDDFMDKILSNGPQRSSGPTRGPGGPGQQNLAGPTRGPSPGGPARGPSPGGPSRGPSGPSRGPSGPPRDPSGPARGPSPGGPARGPSPEGPARGSKKSAKRKVVKDGTGKVRKAKVEIDEGLFEANEMADRNAAVDWAKGAVSDGDNERTVMMQLQETGWSAPQSRAIYMLAKK